MMSLTKTHIADRLAAGPVTIRNVAIPAPLIDPVPPGGELARVDLTIADGRIAAIAPAGIAAAEGATELDLKGGMALPLFADIHTHLDKGHILPRQENPDGRFMGALLAVKDDREANWSGEDVRRRMDFSLRSAFAHGTRAIRTHLDSIAPQDAVSWPVFAETRADWAGRIELQAVSLVGPDTMMEPDALEALALRVKAHGGIFGGAISSFPDVREAIGNVVKVAARHGLDLDLHLDETEDSGSQSLLTLAETVIATGFEGGVVAGHCCSLARQDAATVDRTLDLVAKAGIAIVSLPMCNLYLQDRHLASGNDEDGSGLRRTPRWRGVTLIHEMLARGIKVAVASDNTRDPFHAYGDLDGLEVMREATRILHLDHADPAFAGVMTRMPADIAGFAPVGRIGVGLAADLVLFRARRFDELYARPQADRIVIRAGKVSSAALPDYSELDDLFGDAA